VTRNKVLTERARHAVERLGEAGITFAITSGRPPKGMTMLIEPLRLATPIAGFNGGQFVRPDLAIIEERTLAADIASEAIELIRSHGLDVWAYAGDQWLVRDPDAPHVEREAWTVKFPPTVVGGFHGYLPRVVKIVGISDDHDLVRRCEADAQARLGGRATATRSQPYYLDVTHLDANKGFVADYLSQSLGIPQAEIATIGDQPNDVLMFRRSGFSIAMGNAIDDVQRQASVTTASNDDEGFANAVERFILR